MRYDWKCTKCGKEIETVCLVKDKKTPRCCGKDMNRVYGTVGIQWNCGGNTRNG